MPMPSKSPPDKKPVPLISKQWWVDLGYKLFT